MILCRLSVQMARLHIPTYHLILFVKIKHNVPENLVLISRIYTEGSPNLFLVVLDFGGTSTNQLMTEDYCDFLNDDTHNFQTFPNWCRLKMQMGQVARCSYREASSAKKEKKNIVNSAPLKCNSNSNCTSHPLTSSPFAHQQNELFRLLMSDKPF